MKRYKILTTDSDYIEIDAKSIIDAVNKLYKLPEFVGKEIKSIELNIIIVPKKEQPVLMLKWGDFKYANFEDSPEANKIADELNHIDNLAERKAKLCQIIDLFNGQIILWWGSQTVSKAKAKKYINCYVSEV